MPQTDGSSFERPRATPTPPRPGPQRIFRPGLRSGIAVAAVAALVAGGAVYLLRDGGSGGDAAGGGKGGEGGARDASGIFAVQPALYDGHEQSISGVAVRGGVAVTVGSETVDRPRGQFLVSADGGQGWALGNVEPPATRRTSRAWSRPARRLGRRSGTARPASPPGPARTGGRGRPAQATRPCSPPATR
ncbi:hypothetical protein ACFQHO_33025 [Actinomadura yumaensis]|uniref:hypothetical protein n=1 Tax=Actinomadura yumaensis TaxID=111807 RepID=UPI0036152BB9